MQVSDPQVGLISPPRSLDWNPMSISWDGSSQLYFTDANEGAIYTVPSLLAMPQEMVKFADAPYCHGIAILLGAQGSGWNGRSWNQQCKKCVHAPCNLLWKMKNAAMCAHARHARFPVFQLVPMTLQEMPKVVREHRPFVEVRVLNSSTSEMTQATSVDVVFLASRWPCNRMAWR